MSEFQSALRPSGVDDARLSSAPTPGQESLFDWEDETAWGEQPSVSCGVENPEVCESCT